MQMHVHQVQINVSESSKIQLAIGLHESQAHTLATEGTLLLTSSTSSYAVVSFEIGAHMWCSGFWHATGTFATELLPLPAVALHPAHHLQQSTASVAGWQQNVVLVRLGQDQEHLLPGLINSALLTTVNVTHRALRRTRALRRQSSTAVMVQEAQTSPYGEAEEPKGMEEEAQLLTSLQEIPIISKCWLRPAQAGGLNLTVRCSRMLTCLRPATCVFAAGFQILPAKLPAPAFSSCGHTVQHCTVQTTSKHFEQGMPSLACNTANCSVTSTVHSHVWAPVMCNDLLRLCLGRYNAVSATCQATFSASMLRQCMFPRVFVGTMSLRPAFH